MSRVIKIHCIPSFGERHCDVMATEKLPFRAPTRRCPCHPMEGVNGANPEFASIASPRLNGTPQTEEVLRCVLPRPHILPRPSPATTRSCFRPSGTISDGQYPVLGANSFTPPVVPVMATLSFAVKFTTFGTPRQTRIATVVSRTPSTAS
jgi:hypothetical protein